MIKTELWDLIESYAPRFSDQIGWGTMDELCEKIIEVVKSEDKL